MWNIYQLSSPFSHTGAPVIPYTYRVHTREHVKSITGGDNSGDLISGAKETCYLDAAKCIVDICGLLNADKQWRHSLFCFALKSFTVSKYSYAK